jgi:3-phenylpropionate/cinnamic acid dioxygenase small subunit
VTPEAKLAANLTASQLLADYVACIDADDLEQWPDYFTDTALYHVTTAFNYSRSLPAGIIHADGKNMMLDRVASLRQANIYEPQRYRHVISAIRVTAVDEKTIETEANFLVVRIMETGQQDLFVSGRYLDKIDTANGTPRYQQKIVVVDSEKVDTLLAIPL